MVAFTKNNGEKANNIFLQHHPYSLCSMSAKNDLTFFLDLESRDLETGRSLVSILQELRLSQQDGQIK